MSRKNKSLAATVPINFLLTCSDTSLMSIELKYMADAANSRTRLHEILDQLIHETAQAGIARWFRTHDRQQIQDALDHPQDILAWAREEIREGQRSEAKGLMPESGLSPGSTHIEASLKYQQKNTAQGLCALCEEPLAPYSVRYCKNHSLKMARRRASAKYQKKRMAEGKCAVCGELLDRNSVQYCEKHLALKRGRNERYGARKTLKALTAANERRAKAKDGIGEPEIHAEVLLQEALKRMNRPGNI